MTKSRTAGQVGIWALALGLVLAALMSVMLAASKPAHAAQTFTVNSTVDPGNGVCDFSCTLREAITAANNTPGRDTIKFNIFGSGVRTISPDSKLPAITEAVTINGYTQPGSSVNTLAKGTNAVLKIELDGSNAGGFADGLDIKASNVVVRGLIINRFEFGSGIAVTGASTTGVKVEGTFIGIDASGTQDRGNRFGGVFIENGEDNTVGGTSPFQRNLISGNGFAGVSILRSAGGNKVEGNLIGTQKDGKGSLSNDTQGVFVFFSDDTFVGGSSPEAANTIAFNGGDGVVVTQSGSTGNRISGNSIFSNGGLGIDLVGGTENETGATKNDPGDTDTGANALQNKPKIKSATNSSGKTTITGKLDSTPRKAFVVEFYSNPSGTDEGKKFLGNKAVSTDSNGKATFIFTPSQAIPAGQTVTATATNVVEANTSEFSGPRAVVAQ